MASALVALATTTLASSSATVTFSSLPTSGYRDLRLVLNGKLASGNQPVGIRFNGDTTQANFPYVYMIGDGTNTGSGTSTSAAGIWVGSWNLNDGVITVDVMDYSATDKHKTTLARHNTPASDVAASAGRWANTAAITSIAINSGTSSFAAGSTFSLYGVVS